MRLPLLAFTLVIGCGSKVDPPEGAADSSTDSSIDSSPDSSIDSAMEVAVDDDTRAPDTFVAPPDVVPPMGCAFADPLNPPIGCGPLESGAVKCSTTSKVDTCPSDNPCMARAKQTADRLQHRVGRLRLWAPDALLSLTSIAFDPNVNARCVNSGSESFSVLLDVNRIAGSVRIGPARASTDGATFSFLNEDYTGSAAAAICPGFVGPAAPLNLRPVTAAIAKVGTTGFRTPVVPMLNLTIFESSGAPMVLPLRDVVFHVPSIDNDGMCIGAWDKSYWCDGDTLGWKTGGSLLAKITAEDADRVPVRSAGCQSLCAILVNDATKTDGKVCRRGPDGKLPELGNACAGGEGCKNAFLLSATFGSYGVTIK